MTLIEKNSLSKYILYELQSCDAYTTLILKDLSNFINYCVLSINEYYMYLDKFKKYEKMHNDIQNKINVWIESPELSYESHKFSKSTSQKIFLHNEISKICYELKRYFSNICVQNVYLKMKELCEKKYVDFYFYLLDDYFEDFKLMFYIKNLDTCNFYKNKMHQKMKFFNLFMSLTTKMHSISLNNK